MKIQRSIKEQNMRVVALLSLATRFLEALRMCASPLVSIEVKNIMSGAQQIVGDGEGRARLQGNGLERFLPPDAQMAAAEGAIIDGEICLLKLQRKQKQSDLTQKFYNQALAIGARASSGREYLKELIVLKEVFLRNISADDAVSMEVVNVIAYGLGQRQFRCASGLKFLPGPSLPKGQNKKNPLLTVLGAGVGWMFFMVSLALVMPRWRKNAQLFAEDNGLTATAI